MARTSFLLMALFASNLLLGCGGDREEPQPQPVAFPDTLNDSGRRGCASMDQAQVVCETAVAGQDAQHGRDAAQQAGQLIKIGRGDGGFDFSRLGSDGMPLVSQSGVWTSNGTAAEGTFWECVRDNATDLIWEVKHSSPQHARWVGSTYSWYSSNAATNGGVAGSVNLGSCNAGSCDAQGYVAYLNSIALCGYTDWRLPRVSELLSIAHHGRENPSIDASAFPNANDLYLRYWTADTVAEIPQIAWYVYFSDGSISFTQKDNASHLRLVRSDND